MGPYGSLLIPAVVALVLLVAILKVVGAIFKLVALVVLVAVLAGGYLLYGRISTVQKVADTLGARHITSVGLATGIARQAASSAGLNPDYVRVSCANGQGGAQMQLRYADNSFLFGILSSQEFVVPLSTGSRC